MEEKDNIIEEQTNDEQEQTSGEELNFEKLLDQNLEELEQEKLLQTAKLFQAMVKINFSHLESIKTELEKKQDAEKRAEEYLTSARRLQRDFDNYKRNNVEAVKNAEKKGIIKTVEEILEVVDNFERAFKADKTGESKGFEMIYKQLLGVLTSIGVEEINAMNEPLNPDLHNAILQIDSEKESGTVVDVVKKGYKLGDSVIRYSQVVVSK